MERRKHFAFLVCSDVASCIAQIPNACGFWVSTKANINVADCFKYRLMTLHQSGMHSVQVYSDFCKDFENLHIFVKWKYSDSIICFH